METVTEKLDDARVISYDESRRENLRCRVVTMAGDLIRMNGNMVSADTRQGQHFGQKTNQAEELKLREAVKAINEDIEETTSRITEVNYNIDTLNANVKANKDVIRQNNNRSNHVHSHLHKDEETVQALHTELCEVQKQVEDIAVRLRAKEHEVSRTEKDVLEVGRHFYDDIAKAMGIPNIQVVIAERKKAVALKHNELRDIEELILTLKTDIVRTKSSIKDDEAQSKRLCEEVRKKEHDLNSASERCEQCEKKVEQTEMLLTDKRKEHREAKNEFEAVENKLKELRAECVKAKTELTSAQNQERKTNKVRSLMHAKYKDLEHAHLDGVLIPAQCPKEFQESENVVGGTLFEEKNADQIEEALSKITIDYSLLGDEARVLANSEAEEARDEARTHTKTKLDSLQKQIQELPQSLNLNAQAEYAELCAQFRDQTEEAEQMVKQSQDLQRRYECVRDERYERFMSCFREIEKEVDPIYKQLTTFDDREGGSAFLDLEFPDEPFAGGTLFTACPPGKRFFDMSLLSGGEKSMASMALLMAMHSHSPPPFMILDEVDAPFDRKNTDALVRFLRKMPFQSIVISLKDKFFCYADACIGIYKDKFLQSSGSLTLRLDDIEEN